MKMVTELKDTVDGMLNEENYRERFQAEYYQLKIRINKLEDAIKNYENIDSPCAISVLKKQLRVMKKYLKILKFRAEVEEVLVK